MAICNAVSECGSITASIECAAAIVQGEDYSFRIQLNNADGGPLDLCLYDAIVMKLYGEDNDINYHPVYYGYWGYPQAVLDYNPNITETLEILQDGCPPPEPVPDQGVIGFLIPHSISSHFNTGNLFAEIKLKEQPGSYVPPTGTYVTGQHTGSIQPDAVYTTITCLKIGTVKRSYTRDLLF